MYLGRLSTDRFGQQLEQLLVDDGVNTSTIVRTDDPTTLALAEIDDQGAAAYRFYTEGTAAPGLTHNAAIAALPPAVSALHLGTLGLVLEPMAASLEAVAAEAVGGALVAVDANVRPAAIVDPVAYRERLSRVLSCSHLLKVSEEDVEWLLPGVEPVAAVRQLLAEGPILGLLTRGADGAAVITTDAAVDVASRPVTVVDTISAGDAFGGGFLAWWHHRELSVSDLGRAELRAEAAAFACAVAGMTCARAGAGPPFASELGWPSNVAACAHTAV